MKNEQIRIAGPNPKPKPSPDPKPASPPKPPPSRPQGTQESHKPKASGTSAYSADHLDGLIERLSGDAGGGAGAAPAATLTGETLISQEAFFVGFQHVFKIGHAMTALQSLAVPDGDLKARAASDALYDTILEVPALHFLIKPGGKWVQRATAIGMFAVPVAIGCKAELEARRAAAKASKSAGDGEGGPIGGGETMENFEEATKHG